MQGRGGGRSYVRGYNRGILPERCEPLHGVAHGSIAKSYVRGHSLPRRSSGTLQGIPRLSSNLRGNKGSRGSTLSQSVRSVPGRKLLEQNLQEITSNNLACKIQPVNINVPGMPGFSSFKNSLQEYCSKLAISSPIYEITTFNPTTGEVRVAPAKSKAERMAEHFQERIAAQTFTGSTIDLKIDAKDALEYTAKVFFSTYSVSGNIAMLSEKEAEQNAAFEALKELGYLSQHAMFELDSQHKVAEMALANQAKCNEEKNQAADAAEIQSSTCEAGRTTGPFLGRGLGGVEGVPVRSPPARGRDVVSKNLGTSAFYRTALGESFHQVMHPDNARPASRLGAVKQQYANHPAMPFINLPGSPGFSSFKNSLQEYCSKTGVALPVYYMKRRNVQTGKVEEYPAKRPAPRTGVVEEYPAKRPDARDGLVEEYPAKKPAPRPGVVEEYPATRPDARDGMVEEYPAKRPDPTTGTIEKYPAEAPGPRISGASGDEFVGNTAKISCEASLYTFTATVRFSNNSVSSSVPMTTEKGAQQRAAFTALKVLQYIPPRAPFETTSQEEVCKRSYMNRFGVLVRSESDFSEDGEIYKQEDPAFMDFHRARDQSNRDVRFSGNYSRGYGFEYRPNRGRGSFGGGHGHVLEPGISAITSLPTDAARTKPLISLPGSTGFVSYADSLQEYCARRRARDPVYEFTSFNLITGERRAYPESERRLEYNRLHAMKESASFAGGDALSSSFANRIEFRATVRFMGQAVSSKIALNDENDAEQCAAFEALKVLEYIPLDTTFASGYHSLLHARKSADGSHCSAESYASAPQGALEYSEDVPVESW